MKPTALLAALLLAAAGFTATTVPAQQPDSLRGEVLEVLNVESYTYLRLKTQQGETWAAVPTAAVKKGAQVTIGNTMQMENFESKALKRKFDRIVFGSIAGPNAKSAAALPATPHTVAPAAPHAAVPAAPHGAGPAASAPVVKIAKATGPDAKTVAEVVKGKAALKDKTVLVRAQVVKVTAGILGKNWLHVQDGSGSVADGSNDIIVTTKDQAAVGDVVNAKGTVRTDVNVGSGYAYAVLIEDAAVRK